MIHGITGLLLSVDPFFKMTERSISYIANNILFNSKIITMALWIILGIIVLLIIWIIGMYNGFVKAKIKVDNSWSDIRVFLKKRFDLIPNLVNTVKGYAAHESQTFEKVLRPGMPQ